MHNQPTTKPLPTPLHYRVAFLESCEAYSNWYPGQPEPTISFEDGDITLGEACRLVEACQSPIPKSCRETLIYADVAPEDYTYSSAAKALLEAVKARI